MPKLNSKHHFFPYSMGYLILLFLLLSPGLFASDAPLVGLSDEDAAAIDSGMAAFLPLMNRVWSGNAKLERTMSLLERVEKNFRLIRDDAARNYLLARVENYRGRITLMTSTKDRSRKYFNNAMELAKKSIDARESAEGYRVLADAGSSWSLTKGLIGMITMGSKMKEWSDKAIEIDPQNALAVIIAANGLIHAPAFSGGNPKEALNRLSIQNRRQDLSDIERFWTLVSLSAAHKKLGQDKDAARRCEEASSIFPNNPMLENCR